MRTLRLDPTRLARRGIYMPQTIANRTTEEFRLIKRAALRRAAQAREDGNANANLVMVTSAKEGEGKTFVSLNLALSLAVEDAASVVLIDADTAKSSVSRHLGLPETDGLMELLEDPSAPAEQVMLATSVERLSVIPAGRPHRLGVELLASRRMGTILREIAERDPNRMVVLDAPPLLAATEPSALAAQVGQVLFVVETDRTSRAAVQESLGMLAVCPQVGLVLNKARFNFGGVRFGTYYSDYYASMRRRERSRQRAGG
jgi:receptor protein-tyrosine kinase